LAAHIPDMYRKIFLFITLAALVLCNAKLAVSLTNSRKENRRLLRRIDSFSAESENIKNQFILKQDHMRKMLTDSDLLNQMVRQKEGYIKPREKLFKFED
jgi:cell division protein FtsB